MTIRLFNNSLLALSPLRKPFAFFLSRNSSSITFHEQVAARVREYESCGIVLPHYARTGGSDRAVPVSQSSALLSSSSSIPSGDRSPSPSPVQQLEHACALASSVLARVAAEIRAGVTTEELDAVVHAFCLEHRVYPSPLNYRGFPRAVCVSVNDVVCHGVPNPNVRLAPGDLVKVDVTLFNGHMHGDVCRTFLVPMPLPLLTPQPQPLSSASSSATTGSQTAPISSGDAICSAVSREEYLRRERLMHAARDVLAAAIAACAPGRPLNAIPAAIERTLRSYPEVVVVPNVCGHGIGHEFHQQPLHIAHHLHHTPAATSTSSDSAKDDSNSETDETATTVLQPGMAITLEPAVALGSGRVRLEALPLDYIFERKQHETRRRGRGVRQTPTPALQVRTLDGEASAQFEHTILIEKEGARVLTTH